MQSDYFRTLAAYNRWANEKILSAAAMVDEADYFAIAPGLSFGSLHATLVHALLAEMIWMARFEGSSLPDDIKVAESARLAMTSIPTFAEVRRLYDVEMAKQERFFAALTDEQAEAPLLYTTQAGQPITQPLNEVIGHFINHGTQFRTEASVRLSQLGHSPGDLDLIIYQRLR